MAIICNNKISIPGHSQVYKFIVIRIASNIGAKVDCGARETRSTLVSKTIRITYCFSSFSH